MVHNLAGIMSCEKIFEMMTSSNGDIFRVTGPFSGESTGHRWIPLTNASDAEFWCLLWCAPEQTAEQNNRDTGDLRRHRVHYDVNIMIVISNQNRRQTHASPDQNVRRWTETSILLKVCLIIDIYSIYQYSYQQKQAWMIGRKPKISPGNDDAW